MTRLLGPLKPKEPQLGRRPETRKHVMCNVFVCAQVLLCICFVYLLLFVLFFACVLVVVLVQEFLMSLFMFS